MKAAKDLEVQRGAVLSQMRLIRSMKRGTLSIRPEKVYRKGQKEPVLLGPYPLFVRSEGKRSVGKRLRSPEEVAQVREDIAAYERFVALSKEYVELTEQLGELERLDGREQETLKKTPKWLSRKTRR